MLLVVSSSFPRVSTSVPRGRKHCAVNIVGNLIGIIAGIITNRAAEGESNTGRHQFLILFRGGTKWNERISSRIDETRWHTADERSFQSRHWPTITMTIMVCHGEQSAVNPDIRIGDTQEGHRREEAGGAVASARDSARADTPPHICNKTGRERK